MKGRQAGTNSSQAPETPHSTATTHHSTTSIPMGHSGWFKASVAPAAVLTVASNTLATDAGVKAYTSTSAQGGCPKNACGLALAP